MGIVWGHRMTGDVVRTKRARRHASLDKPFGRRRVNNDGYSDTEHCRDSYADRLIAAEMSG
jgi:hypothetical protein